MEKLNLTFACGDYDRIRPLSMNRVQPEGIDLNYIPLEPEELFWRIIQNEEFDISEFSLAAYNVLRGRNDDRFVAIPVFTSREFRHSAVFINNNSGIKKPEDLKGKRIGVPDYTMTATVWIRGIWQDEHGVKSTDVKWLTGGMDNPGRKQRIDVNLPDNLDVEYIGDDNTLSEMLDNGEIDALIGARAPKCFHEGSSNVSRLWPDYINVEQDYFKRTGIFPIMHTLVIKREILKKYPWVAQSLFKAFSQAKQMCQDELYTLAAPKYMIPWYLSTYETVLDLMGEDYWPYGLEKNRKVLETFSRYCHEQGLAENLVVPDKMFASSTLEPYVI